MADRTIKIHGREWAKDQWGQWRTTTKPYDVLEVDSIAHAAFDQIAAADKELVAWLTRKPEGV